MSWFERLVETYDACFDRPQFASEPLMPVGAISQRTQLHVTIWPDGTFFHAELHELDNTTMFVTEESAGRSGKAPAPNPLTDQLEYCAAGMGKYGGDSSKHRRYRQLLSAWVESGTAGSKIEAVCTYVNKGNLLDDLLRERVLTESSGRLAKVKLGKKEKPLDAAKIWVRWSVAGNLHADTWSDVEIQKGWAAYENSQASGSALCMYSGKELRTTQKHPKYIRYPGDNAKLISANDDSGFTYRGRFTRSDEALAISHEATQKAHNALRWLIKRRHASMNGTQSVISWSVFGGDELPILEDSSRFFLEAEEAAAVKASAPAQGYVGDAGQYYARRLSKAVSGYSAKFNDTARTVVMVLDSASETHGRMAMLYYRELTGSELLGRLERWHSGLAWPQRYDKRFVGVPAPAEIAKAAYGRVVEDKFKKDFKLEVDEKLLRATIERLLPCIVDARPLPRDLVLTVAARASNRAGLRSERLFEQVLGVACSLIRGHQPKEFPSMGLDETRTTRSYLYGMLLAIADDIESVALKVSQADRSTNAARLMQRFSSRPASTWFVLWKQLTPYIQQLKQSRPGYLFDKKRLLDTVTAKFEELPNGLEQFKSDQPLEPEFLLGYHGQRLVFEKELQQKRLRGLKQKQASRVATSSIQESL